MEFTKNMEDRLKDQGWTAIETFFDSGRTWYQNSKFQGCLILIDEDWSELDRWGGKVVTQNNINEVNLMPKLHPLN